jgi:hypothetical protein
MEDPEWLNCVVKQEEARWKKKHGATLTHTVARGVP